jgi:hypothetical protein
MDMRERLPSEDVVGHGGNVVFVSKGAGEGEHEGCLP